MNTLSPVIPLATSPIRVILSADSSHQWDTRFGVAQRCLRPGCSRWADNPSKLTQTNCAWSLAGQVDNTLAKTSRYLEIARFVPIWCCHDCHDPSALRDERSDWFQDIRCFHRPLPLQRTDSCFLFLHRSGGYSRFGGDEYSPAINHYEPMSYS